MTLRFLASGDSYVGLQYLFKISKQAISCIAPEACEVLVEKLNDYVQVKQILLFVVYERSLKLDCNQNFYLNALGALGTHIIYFFYNVRLILGKFPESTPFPNYQNAQETTQHCRLVPLFKIETSGMKRRAKQLNVVTCHVARPDLLRP